MTHFNSLWRDVRGKLALLAVLIIALALISGMQSGRLGFESSELAFTDASSSGLQIVPASCPSSPHYAGECTSIIIVNTCPTGQHKNVSQTCVCDSTNLAPVNGTCAPLSTLCPAPTYYCGTGANANNLYYRTYSSAPACSPQSSLYANCFYGCDAATATCRESDGTPAVSITVTPSLVRSGNTTVVNWVATRVRTCTVTATNADTWTGHNGTQTSRAITSMTTYTLTCTRDNGTQLTDTATVNIIPVFNEN